MGRPDKDVGVPDRRLRLSEAEFLGGGFARSGSDSDQPGPTSSQPADSAAEKKEIVTKLEFTGTF